MKIDNKDKVKVIKANLMANAVVVYGDDVEGLAHSIKCINEEFATTTVNELVERYEDLVEKSELDNLVGQVVTIRKTGYTPEGLIYKKGIIIKADSKSCIYVEVEGNQYKLNIEDLAIQSERLVGKRIMNTYRCIEVRSFDNSATGHRVCEMSLNLPRKMVRKDAIRYGKAMQIVQGKHFKDTTYQVY